MPPAITIITARNAIMMIRAFIDELTVIMKQHGSHISTRCRGSPDTHLLVASFKPSPTNSAPVARLRKERVEEPSRRRLLIDEANQAINEQ